MAERLKKLEPGFSVADADHPRLAYDENELSVVFVDWTDQEIELRFSSCYAVRWQGAAERLSGERGDAVYEIEGSAWLALHREQHAVEAQEPIRHFRLNFNACGQLDVLAEEMVLR